MSLLESSDHKEWIDANLEEFWNYRISFLTALMAVTVAVHRQDAIDDFNNLIAYLLDSGYIQSGHIRTANDCLVSPLFRGGELDEMEKRAKGKGNSYWDRCPSRRWTCIGGIAFIFIIFVAAMMAIIYVECPLFARFPKHQTPTNVH